MLMVGMEGSAVLAVRKVVVVAREAERNLGWKPTRRSPKRAEDVVLDVRTTLSRSTT